MLTPWLEDADVRLYHGDVLAVLRDLPAESVDCCVTSPPYWGLRDYGTGAWEGGDSDCEHRVREDARIESSTLGGGKATTGHQREGFKDVCPRCGATRIDQQLGLEPTPEEYVTRMVEVFREVRRVLVSHGTVFLNLGDSYFGTGRGPSDRERENRGFHTKVTRSGFPESNTYSHSVLKSKDLVGVPWRVAFALQADGWYLRSDITWCKPNAMPESVMDRPTKATEMIFLLSKNPRYYYDAEAIRQPHKHDGRQVTQVVGGNGSLQHRDGERWPGSGANARNWWLIPTQPYPNAHFATFPEELARRCIAAGCPEQVCRVCGKARERVVEVERPTEQTQRQKHLVRAQGAGAATPLGGTASTTFGLPAPPRETLGFTDCACSISSNGSNESKHRVGVVLDPFIGSGTVAHVARKLGRNAIGIDLNESYLELAARRLQQQSLFTEAAS
jgi:DNA modification methylase